MPESMAGENTPTRRALDEALLCKLGGSMNLFEPIPAKPKWMRWRTYDRHIARIEAAEGINIRAFLQKRSKAFA
jgi:hypothetical protein